MNPPKSGEIITVKCDGYDANGKLHLNHLNPVYLRVREDVTWDELKKKEQSTPKL
jgi:hypothetical protein